MKTDQPENTKHHFRIFRGNDHKRTRLKISNIGDTSITKPLTQNGDMKLDESNSKNWIGQSWMKLFNKGKMPSLNQIKEGLIAEFLLYKNLETAYLDNLDLKFAALENAKKTWQELFGKLTGLDCNMPLGQLNKGHYKGVLRDPDSPVVVLILFIFQM